MKTCGSCKATKDASAFHTRTKSADGLSYTCKECSNERRKTNHAANREQRKERMREYYIANRDRLLAQKKHWHKRNPESYKAAGKRYQIRHPEKTRERACRYRLRKANAPVVEKIDRLAVFARDKGICHICGFDVDPTAWELDHVVPLSKGGSHSENNVRVAHMPCNRSKGARVLDPQLSFA